MWGVSPLIYKKYSDKMNYKTIMIIIGIISFLGSIVLYIIDPEVVKSDISKTPSTHILLLCLLVFLTFFVGNAVYMYALKDNESYKLASIVSIAPVITLLISVFFFKQQVDWKGIVGVLLASFGVAAIALNDTNPK